MHNDNWDDLRYILCVATTGSVLQAAKRLGVNHATVLRHVAAFEQRHNATLFERTAQGYRLLPDSAHIIQAAQNAETAMQEVARLASGGRLPRSETIRITSTDTLCSLILPQFITGLRGTDQDQNFVLLSSNAHIDLLREQAHIVVRPTTALTEDLVGIAAGTLSFAAYAADPAETKWLGLSGPLRRSDPGKWMAQHITTDQLTATADSFLTLAALAVSGQGIAILPRFVGDTTTGLRALPKKIPALDVPVWVAHHIDAKETPQMIAVRSMLVAFLKSIMTPVHD